MGHIMEANSTAEFSEKRGSPELSSYGTRLEVPEMHVQMINKDYFSGQNFTNNSPGK